MSLYAQPCFSPTNIILGTSADW